MFLNSTKDSAISMLSSQTNIASNLLDMDAMLDQVYLFFYFI
jgi:hypothetical protein